MNIQLARFVKADQVLEFFCNIFPDEPRAIYKSLILQTSLIKKLILSVQYQLKINMFNRQKNILNTTQKSPKSKL